MSEFHAGPGSDERQRHWVPASWNWLFAGSSQAANPIQIQPLEGLEEQSILEGFVEPPVSSTGRLVMPWPLPFGTLPLSILFLALLFWSPWTPHPPTLLAIGTYPFVFFSFFFFIFFTYRGLVRPGWHGFFFFTVWWIYPGYFPWMLCDETRRDEATWDEMMDLSGLAPIKPADLA
jgi:hypothetical protein